jgi:hypothetical protein
LRDAAGVLPAPLGQAASAFGLFYGVPTWGFAAVWMVLAAALTLRTTRQKLPFSLTWWSFTFPVGTVVTGTSALSAQIHADLFTVTWFVLYLLLAAAWITVAIRTAYGSYRGYLFEPTPTPPFGVPVPLPIEMTGSLLGNERGDHPGEGAGEIGGGHQRGDYEQNQLWATGRLGVSELPSCAEPAHHRELHHQCQGDSEGPRLLAWAWRASDPDAEGGAGDVAGEGQCRMRGQLTGRAGGGQAQKHQVAGHDAADHAPEPGDAGGVHRARAKGQRGGEDGEDGERH